MSLYHNDALVFLAFAVCSYFFFSARGIKVNDFHMQKVDVLCNLRPGKRRETTIFGFLERKEDFVRRF